MSFTDLLRQARSSRVSVLHKFLTNYDPNSQRLFAFVEGYPDEVFYRAHIQKYEPDPKRLYVYNCEGKRNVYATYRDILKRYPTCERVLFFVDKDLDDIIGVQWPADPRIYVTDFYSVENYVVSGETMSAYFRDFVKIRRVDVDIESALSQFDQQLKRFYRLILPVMAWIVLMRRAGNSARLQDVNLGELFQVTDSGTLRRSNRRAMQYLRRVTQSGIEGSTWQRIRTTSVELRRLPPKAYIRGKFEAWWFIQFGRRIVEGLLRIAGEAGGSVAVAVQLDDRTLIQLLGAGAPTPEQLGAFLKFHLRRSPPDQKAPVTPSPTARQRLLQLLGLRR